MQFRRCFVAPGPLLAYLERCYLTCEATVRSKKTMVYSLKAIGGSRDAINYCVEQKTKAEDLKLKTCHFY